MLDKKLPRSVADSTGDGGGAGSGGGTATAEDRPLNTLLDCMLGNEDVVLSLFWSAGGAGARQSALWDDGNGGGGVGGGAHEGNAAVETTTTTTTKEQRRSPLGKVVLRRSDVLPLVRRTSASVVLRLPIKPAGAGAGAGAGEGDKAAALPVPETLPLSVSYRREPSAVARRKSRGWSGRREVGQAAALGVGGESQEPPQELDASSCEAGGALSQEGASIHPSKAVGLGKAEEKEESGEISDHGRERGKLAEGGGSGGGDDPPGSEARDSRGHTLVHRSSRTEHLLPARTKLCVRVESVCLETGFVEEGRTAGKEGDDLLWVSFEFPGAGSGGQAERKRRGVFVWKPGGGGGGEEAKLPEIHWSPPAAAVVSQGGRCGRVAPLQWRIEVRARFFSFPCSGSCRRCRRLPWFQTNECSALSRCGDRYGTLLSSAVTCRFGTLGGS